MTTTKKKTRGGSRKHSWPTMMEVRVLHMIIAGCDNHTIAATLYISLNTVEKHCHALYTKLGVRDRVGAILWYWQALKQERAGE